VIEKEVDGWLETKYGPNMAWIDLSSKFSIEKIARSGGVSSSYIPPEMQSFIDSIQGKIPKDKVAFYNRALGEFESYGLNNNGDGWLGDELREHHHTFTKSANYFYNHKNNPSADPSYGRPIASAFNERTKMVDLIILADLNKQAEQDIQTLEGGGSIPTSMGCRVKFDVCTICGNQAKTRDEYCCHVSKTASYPYGMRAVLPDGRVCGVMNPKPIFHDISRLVERPAFVGSEHMLKVARDTSYQIFDDPPAQEKKARVAGPNKTAEMVKRLPGHVTSALVPGASKVDAMRRAAHRLSQLSVEIPTDGIRKRADALGLSNFDLMMGSIACGVVLSPREFGHLIGGGTGGVYRPAVAVGLLDDVPAQKIATMEIRPAAAELFAPFGENRGCTQPYLLNRMSSAVSRPTPLLKVSSRETASDMYHCYRAMMLSCIDKVPASIEMPIVKTAGTASRILTPSSIAFALLAFSGDDVPEIGVDGLAKTSALGDTGYRTGRISGGTADMIGLETLELMSEMSMEDFQRSR